jgi:ABC-type phosphate/phosphonate transport system permease subunit
MNNWVNWLGIVSSAGLFSNIIMNLEYLWNRISWPAWLLSAYWLLTREWSDPTCQNLPRFFFFFTAGVHTTKSTVKILAANTHCKYFLKMAEVTHFSVHGTACTWGLCSPLCRLMSRPLQPSPRLSQPYRVLHTAPSSARGGHFSKGLAGYNIGNVQQFLKNTCSAY